jgi:serine/threonine-protein kinase
MSSDGSIPSDSRSSIRSSGGGPFIPPKIGGILGRYEIIAPIGHGAMATVFSARDMQLGREVAIKVMSMALAARGDAGERFRREAQAVATLRHPSILEIYDFVPATEEEPSYIVTERINGPTLRQILEQHRGRLLPEVAALIALPLAEALAIAHERGVVHRDVKPDNVMIEPRSEKSRVVLTDFGVAHITGLETMTATGALVGSPAYMSPEQARSREMGPPTDFWALGALLYEMVTGVLPFAGKDPFTVITAIVRGTFRRPSQIIATVGPEFESMILRCLKSNPAERYANAGLFAADLRTFLRQAGLENEGLNLRQFLDSPEEFEKKLRPKVADICIGRARLHMRRGELARALAEISHATAYVPKHPGAEKLLRRLTVGKAAIKVVILLIVSGLVTLVILLGRPLLHPKPIPVKAPEIALTQRPLPPTSSPPAKKPAAIEIIKPPVLDTDLSNKPTTPASVTASRNRKTKLSGSKTKPTLTPELRPEEPNSIESPPKTELPVPIKAPVPVVPNTPVLTPQKTLPGTIALFAKGGFCYPSLDNHPAKELMPTYTALAPGKHKVYCSRTLKSPREFAGEIDLLPGIRIERTVIEEGGHFKIARPQ